MEPGGRVVMLSLDGGDPTLVRALAEAGEMPAVARLLAEGTSAPVQAPLGVFVSANWPTIFTAREPDRHGYLCWDEIDPVTYEHRETEPNATTVHGTPIWERFSEEGLRSVVFDVPHTWATPIEGQMVVEWGCHDRHHGPHTWPADLLGKLDAAGGPHPVGCAEPPGRDQFAPCDYLDRQGPHRTHDEEVALLARLQLAVERKREASLQLLADGDWDVFLSVFGEGHCAGHQLWRHHDPTHPRHDPDARRRLGVDPVVDIYRRIDAAFGDHLALLRPDDTVYLLLPHGMISHFDGTDVLDPLLARLDAALDAPESLGRATRLAAAITKPLPAPLTRALAERAAPLVRRRADAVPPATEGALPPAAERRWFAVPNNSVSGAVRLNLAGREGSGRIAPQARGEVLRWLADRLREVVNVDTGRAAVREVVITDDVYRRHDGDLLADLYIEWARDAPIERVWSPMSGTVARPYRHWRTGDHVGVGLVVAVGPGIAAGASAEPLRSVDVGATLAAAAHVTLHDVDGEASAALLPTSASRGVRRRSMVGRGAHSAHAARRSLDRRAARRINRSRLGGRWEAGPDAKPVRSAEFEGLSTAHHQTREMVEALANRVKDLEREVQVARTSAWLQQVPLVSDHLVSVIMPTHNRCELVLQAIASVEAQSYPRWELLVVDDASTDGTWKMLGSLDDSRIRPIRGDGKGAASARNLGLDHATGSLIVHLDDDNRFAPDWLKAVVWTFEEQPEARVAYGARLIDDVGRHHGRPRSDTVGFQFLDWDRPSALTYNRVDMNVLAHRPSPARIDESLQCYVDWDLLLTLTADTVPVEISVVAAMYTTDAPDRLSNLLVGDADEDEVNRVRTRHAGT